jgi:hypothetical protein
VTYVELNAYSVDEKSQPNRRTETQVQSRSCALCAAVIAHVCHNGDNLAQVHAGEICLAFWEGDIPDWR